VSGQSWSFRRPLLSWLGAAIAVACLTALLIGIVVQPANGLWFLGFAGYLVVGAIIVWQQPGNRIGWLLLASGVSFVAAATLNTSGGESALTRAPASVEALLQPVFPLPYLCLLCLVTLFPTGRAETRGQRILLTVTAGLGALICLTLMTDAKGLVNGRPNPLAVSIMQPIDQLVRGSGFAVVPALLAVALGNLIVRLRRSSGVTRLQYLWFVWGLTVCLLTVVALWLSNWSQTVAVLALGFNALPVAVGVAVLRYRLFDIDRVISRTTSYVLVTGTVIAVYALNVTLISHALPNQSSLPVAAATLVAAAAFQPVLRWVRTRVDRRFDRTRYDQQRTVDRFGRELRAQVRTQEVRDNLLTTVQGALQPTTTTLWLRESA
jgi:hypothetical protein